MKTSSSRAKFAPLLFLLTAATIITAAQPSSASEEKLPLKVALVLTPEFCRSKIAHIMPENSNGGIEAGKAACIELEPALKDVFTTLTTISDSKEAGDAQLIFTPKFVDACGLLEGPTSFSNFELDLFLEWTATDSSGKTIWLETVEGSATRHLGNLFTAKKNLRLNTGDAVKDLAVKSASKISASPELRKFGQ